MNHYLHIWVQNCKLRNSYNQDIELQVTLGSLLRGEGIYNADNTHVSHLQRKPCLTYKIFSHIDTVILTFQTIIAITLK